MAKAVKFDELGPIDISKKSAAIYAPEIVKAAMSLFMEGNIVERVNLAPHIYPDLMQELNREVDFMELYGRKTLSLQGLTCVVRPEGESAPWSKGFCYELVTHPLENQSSGEDTLIVKIARTWESCQLQCEQGYPCPLLAEVGANLEAEVMDACSALANIETAVSQDEEALSLTTAKFLGDLKNGSVGSA